MAHPSVRRAEPARLEKALRSAAPFGGGPACDIDDQESERWASGGATEQFERSQKVEGTIAALQLAAAGLRSGLADLQRILSR